MYYLYIVYESWFLSWKPTADRLRMSQTYHGHGYHNSTRQRHATFTAVLLESFSDMACAKADGGSPHFFGSEAPFFKPHNMKFHQYKTWESIPKKEMPCSFKTSGLQCQKQIQAYLLFAYQVRKRNSYAFSPMCFCICPQVRLTITVRPINCTMMKSCTHDIANGCFLPKSRLTENPVRPHSTKINSKKT